MDHFAPHPGSQFEGYYSKFDLPSGARLAVIITSVPNAKHRPHMVLFSYIPKGTNDYFQREISIDSIEMLQTSPDGSFELRAPGIGIMSVKADSTTTYTLHHADFSFTAITTSHQPWSTRTSTPEGPLVYLPLPLHWHVHSLASSCSFTLSIPSSPLLAAADKSGTALVHQEKNWATSFPSAHIWIQARQDTVPVPLPAENAPRPPPRRTLCIAGGQILGTEAYLLGYRSTAHPRGVFELDFRPPYAVRLLGRSPCLAVKPDFAARRFALSARSWGRRIDVDACAPAETFFPLSAPFADGHLDNLLAQSFRAEIRVKVYAWKWGVRWWDVRGWWGEGREDVGCWELEEEAVFEDGSLEFGGEYYGFAGSATRRAR